MRGNRGFTLPELLVVLGIVALLVALVAPTLMERLKPARRTAARAQIELFMGALDNFYMDAGRFPRTEEGLEALRARPKGVAKWDGPYLKKEIPVDPWGNPYRYLAPGRSGGYEIVSLGADGQEGGEDENQDVRSWEADRR